jgi:flavin reductase (DIM6/NTAB) family NADH-FMN oxidoreductase RutF
MQKTKISSRFFGPFPIVLVGAEVEGKPTYVTVGACGVVNLEPMLYISLRSTHYTTAGIRQSGYFSVNVPSSELVQRTDYCGMVSGARVDKSSVFTAFYDDLGKAPMIRECSTNMLCKVIKSMPISDFEMFFGEILATYVDDGCLRGGRPDARKLDPMVGVDMTYWSLGEPVGSVFREGTGYKADQGA